MCFIDAMTLRECVFPHHYHDTIIATLSVHVTPPIISNGYHFHLEASLQKEPVFRYAPPLSPSPDFTQLITDRFCK